MAREKKPRLKARKDGRYKAVYHGIQFYGDTQEEAIAKRDAYKASEKTGVTVLSSVAEYAVPWLNRSFPEVAATTYHGLAVHLQHLVNVIGDKRISAVVPSDIKEVYSAEYKGCSASYIKSARQLYCALFDAAMADGLTRSNPARERTAKPHKGAKPTTRPITAQEREWINTLCIGHRARPVVMAMLYAGLRPQEAKALIIDRDIDFDKGIITVRETAHTDPENGQKYAYTGAGKTEWSNRQVPLFPPLERELEGKTGYLIASAHGERVTKTTWRVVWNSYVSQMETEINGIQKRWYGKTREHRKLIEEGKPLPAWIPFTVVPYDLRHSFCVMCRDSGAEINTVRKWMGHKDSRMIIAVYDSVSEDRTESEREKVLKAAFQVQKEVQNE